MCKWASLYILLTSYYATCLCVGEMEGDENWVSMALGYGRSFEGLLKRCWIRQTNPILDFEDGKHLWLLKILVKATTITIFSIFTIFYVKRILTVPVTIFSIFSFFM